GALFAVGCSDDGQRSGSPTSASAQIGPAGGKVSAGGASITIPSGALAAEEAITVTLTNDEPPVGVQSLSPIYRFGPAGLRFQKPVTVTFEFTPNGSRA